MILYKKAQERDLQKVAQELYKASALCESRLPHGFYAVASFDFGDIYIDQALDEIINDEIKRKIDESLLRFAREDYGEISEDEKDENLENKYFGNGKNLVGRYAVKNGELEINLLADCTKISLKPLSR